MKLPVTAPGPFKRFTKRGKTTVSEEQIDAHAQTQQPSHHVLHGNALSFRNPWPSASPPSWSDLLVWPVEWSKHAIASHPLAHNLSVTEPTWQDPDRPASADSTTTIKATWLGHATSYASLPSSDPYDRISILFDPIFSLRAGPTPYAGVSRYKRPPCEAADLPAVDLILISHNHYDHADEPSIRDLNRTFPNALFCVPKGNQAWFLSIGILASLVVECDWWDEVCIDPSALGRTNPDKATIRITCVPAQHNSGRAIYDSAKTLWSGWVVEQYVEAETGLARRGAIYFAGDTGYRRHPSSDVTCPAFKEIGDRLGPFDVSFIPIWRGGSLGFVSWLGLRLSHEVLYSAYHCNPADAVLIHRDVRSRHSIPVHFGTFVGSELESVESIVELREACEAQGIKAFQVLDIGQTKEVEVDESLPNPALADAASDPA